MKNNGKKWPIASVAIAHEHDVVDARRRARRIAELLGYDAQQQTRIATAVSEIVRNAFRYAGGGKVEFLLQNGEFPGLVVQISDTGPGIADLDAILEGRYRSATGMGMGILGARRLMDECAIETAPGQGTVVTLRKRLPRGAAPGAALAAQVGEQLARDPAHDPLDEVRRQNQEFLQLVEELRGRNDELARLNNELEATNRGVLALYSELDDKAEHLRRAAQMKSRFLSHMSHEFRTPLNSVLALSRMLLDRTDGPLTAEQEKQLRYIQTSATTLFELVNDLLELARMEAGKTVVRTREFDCAEFLSGLRGVLRPLLSGDRVALIFEEPATGLALHTDESKLSQILRNFVSNAIKFTESGEVQVRAERLDGERVRFSVSDTGLGIAPESIPEIFQEFTQIDSPAQRRHKGTGLGLPVSKRLAELLGGGIEVVSAPGQGSTFAVTIPRVYPGPVAAPAPVSKRQAPPNILAIDDDPVWRYLLHQMMAARGVECQEAVSGREGLTLLQGGAFDAVLLDLRMPGLGGFDVLRQMRELPELAPVPVIVVTSKALEPGERESLAREVAGVLTKDEVSAAGGIERLIAALRAAGVEAGPGAALNDSIPA